MSKVTQNQAPVPFVSDSEVLSFWFGPAASWLGTLKKKNQNQIDANV